jgi:hypothetical protein
MSFLIDPALLYGSGRAYRRLSGRSQPSAMRDAAVGAGFMGLFWGVSVGLYLERRWTRRLWRACRASSGRDWMLNSGVLRLDWRKAGTRTHALSALAFATYPLWLWLGMRRRGR